MKKLSDLPLILARLRGRTFYSLAEVNEAVRELLDTFNLRPMKDYGGQGRKERFETLDKPYAKALPAEPFRITRIKTINSNKRMGVMMEGTL